MPGDPYAFPSDAPGSGESARGMTLRDWFAGQALAAILEQRGTTYPSMIADKAYKIADAMLESRQK